MSQASTTRAVRKRVAAEQEESLARLSEHGLSVGQHIRVAGEKKTVFVVSSMGADGAVHVHPFNDSGSRSFRPEWCYNATRVNRRGRTVDATCPPEAQAARDEWRAARGF